MYCKTITKEIFDSYIANDSDTVLEGVVTNTFGNTTFWRFVRVPLAKGEHYVEALYAQSSFSFPLAMGVSHFWRLARAGRRSRCAPSFRVLGADLRGIARS